MVITGAAGPAGAQAERAGARGKSAAFFSFFSNGTFQVFAEGGVPTRVLIFLRFSSFPLLFLFPIGKEPQCKRETFLNFLCAFEVRKMAGPGRTNFAVGKGEKRHSGGGADAAHRRPGPDFGAQDREGVGSQRRRPRQVSGWRSRLQRLASSTAWRRGSRPPRPPRG